MNAVHFEQREIEIPGSWNELSRRQLLAIVRTILRGEKELRGHLYIFQAFTRIPWWKLKLHSTYAMVEGAYLATAFVTEKNTLTKQIIPKYRSRYGPNDSISNMRMAEFSFAEFYFMQYQASKEESDLNKLIACIYRPKRWFYSTRVNRDGDPRVKFNTNLIERDARKISKWPMTVRTAIMFYYEGCRNQKILAFPKVFEGGSGEESTYGMWSVMRGVAKGGHFGDFDKVAEQFVDTILMELNETIIEGEAMEAKINQAKS